LPASWIFLLLRECLCHAAHPHCVQLRDPLGG
jgi:hypothetical protein